MKDKREQKKEGGKDIYSERKFDSQIEFWGSSKRGGNMEEGHLLSRRQELFLSSEKLLKRKGCGS